MDDKMRRFIQMEADKDAESIAEEVRRDPDLQNVKAPDAIRDNLFAQIREHEAKKIYATLSEEDKELIELGKVYKRRRKWKKWYVLAAVLILAMMFGVTSMGGPEKVVEKVKWMLGGHEQTNVDSDDKRLKDLDGITEVEAYQQIEDEFGFFPVKLFYLPEGMEFQESVISKEAQTVYMMYEKKDESAISFVIIPNHRVGSTGNDKEDTLLEEYTKEVGNNIINIKHYYIEDNGDWRWSAEFEYQNVYYFLNMYNINELEMEKIIENLYFS